MALKRGEALLALDRKEEALELLDAVRDHYDRELRAGLVSREDWQHLRDLHNEASRLADSARAELHGRETLVIQSAAAGKLDGRAGVNYRLLGESLMVGAPPHLAFFHLAGELRAQVEALHREATELEWVAEAYALENPHEFFAVSYTDWLRQRFTMPLRREPDDAGIFDRLEAVFAALARDARE